MRGLAGVAGFSLVPYGEHLALSQLQRKPHDGTPLAANRHFCRRAHFVDLELLTSRAAGDHVAIRRHRHCHSSGRDCSPALPAASSTAGAGASGWLICILIEALSETQSLLSEANRFSEKKFAIYSMPAILRPT